tara:strand:- start:2480 stop:2743 length:264 start_codon:yes stop_codon:yes gene_type:complete
MAKRQVKATRKDDDGDITALCYGGQPWSPRRKVDAINDIERGIHEYYVKAVGTQEVAVKVKSRGGKKYLTTEADSNSGNNLGRLPNC